MIESMADSTPTEAWDQIIHFAVEANMSVEAAASPSFRSVIHTAFARGFQRAIQSPKANLEAEFKEFCPQKRPTALRNCFLHAAAADRVKMEQPLVENKFAAMTMDAGQIGTTKLFVTNLVASHLQCCFTSGIYPLDASQDHKSLRDFLRVELLRLANDKKIHVSVIICDGATYQTKALNWEDSASLQATHRGDLLLSRVLFVPCLCHRLNNAYRALIRNSPSFSQFVVSLRDLGKWCRKPKWRGQFERNCPEFIETRWLYDYRILHFILEHEDTIKGIEKFACKVTPAFHDFSALLENWYKLVTVLEGSSCRLSHAYQLIANTTARLSQIANGFSSSPDLISLREVYTTAIELITRYTVDSSSDILQLAYVLTPAGRQEAYEQMQHVSGSTIPNRPPFSIELVDFESQLADHDIEGTTKSDDEGLADPQEFIPDEMGGNSDEPFFENITEIYSLAVHAADSPSHYLAHRARAGLDRILQQLGLDEDQKAQVKATFHHFLSSTSSSLGVMVGFDRTRYLWLSAQTERPEYSPLAEIALRIEPAICSEGPSERAIGQQRRYLIPHRTRTKPDLLLARTEMEDYQRSGTQQHQHRQ
jgi:hypothetical protein